MVKWRGLVPGMGLWRYGDFCWVELCTSYHDPQLFNEK